MLDPINALSGNAQQPVTANPRPTPPNFGDIYSQPISALRGVPWQEIAQPFRDAHQQYRQDMRNWRHSLPQANQSNGSATNILPAQPAPQPVPQPGQPVQQIAPVPPVNPQGFAPPGMSGSSYLVRGMNPGQSPFDLPTY